MTLSDYRRLWRRACAAAARSGYPRRACFYKLALKARRAHGQRWLLTSSADQAINWATRADQPPLFETP